MENPRAALADLSSLASELSDICRRIGVEGLLVRLSPLAALVLGVPDAAPCDGVVFEVRRWLDGRAQTVLAQLDAALARGDVAAAAAAHAELVRTSQGLAQAVIDVARDLSATVTLSARLERFWDEVITETARDVGDAVDSTPWGLIIAAGVATVVAGVGIALAVRR